MRAAGTLDPVEFRHRAARQADVGRMRAEHAQLEREIGAALAGADHQQLEAWLTGRDDLALLESQASEARRAVAARLAEAGERRGELNYQLKLLAEDRQLAEKQLELDVIDERLAEALKRWRVLAVCNLLLSAVREFYEREHQPQALREASGYLKRLTGGRYTRVWTPLGESSLRVEDRAGHSLTVEVLSSGTREQLLLALRLALVSSHARRGVALPLVLDDVLVNFDVARRERRRWCCATLPGRGTRCWSSPATSTLPGCFASLKPKCVGCPITRRGTRRSKMTRRRKSRSRWSRKPTKSCRPQRNPSWSRWPSKSSRCIRRRRRSPSPWHCRRPLPCQCPRHPPPVRKPRRRVVARTERVRWSAEEFDGELADRVRRDVWVEEDADEAEDDSQAA